jgi:hypothetical protein
MRPEIKLDWLVRSIIQKGLNVPWGFDGGWLEKSDIWVAFNKQIKLIAVCTLESVSKKVLHHAALS